MDSLHCSPATNVSQGITANPDISGIGVRAAVYTQAVLSLVHPLVAGYDSQIKDYELESLFAVYLGILLPGCALLFSSIIQAKTFGLSVYHGLIVLYLSWINNASALTFFTFVFGGGIIASQQEEEWWTGREAWRIQVSKWYQQWQGGVGKSLVTSLNTLANAEKIVETLNEEMKGRMSKYHKMRLKLEMMEACMWRVEIQIAIVNMSPHEGNNAERGYILKNIEGNMRRDQEAVLRFWKEQDLSAMTRWRRHGIGMVRRWLSLSTPIPRNVWIMAALASAHLTLTSALGWWLWRTFPNFGIDQDCIPFTQFTFFFKPIPVTSRTLRSRSIGIYKFSSLPVLNILIWIVLLVATSSFLAWLWIFVLKVAKKVKNDIGARLQSAHAHQEDTELGIQKSNSSDGKAFPHTPSRTPSAPSPIPLPSPLRPIQLRTIFGLDGRAFFFSAVITTCIIQSLFIAFTELTIRNNRHLLKTGIEDPREGDWTFGQTLAITLTIMPSIEVAKFLSTKYQRRKVPPS